MEENIFIFRPSISLPMAVNEAGKIGFEWRGCLTFTFAARLKWAIPPHHEPRPMISLHFTGEDSPVVQAAAFLFSPNSEWLEYYRRTWLSEAWEMV